MPTKLKVGRNLKIGTAVIEVTMIDPGKRLDLVVVKLVSGAWPEQDELLKRLGCKGGGWVALHEDTAEIYCIPM